MNIPKKTLAINDISGFGRAALSVIIPTLSAMKVQVISAPNAIFSTHLGGLGSPQIADLSEYLLKTLEHYKEIELNPDSIFTGFMYKPEQIDICLEYIKAFPQALVYVDPAMADDGRPYATATPELQRSMAKLVSKADIISPNLTEACILLDRKYSNNLSISEYEEILEKLSELGPKEVILTGAKEKEGELTNILYEKSTKSFHRVTKQRLDVSYPGTGDIFSSVYLGCRLSGDNAVSALEKSTDFLEYVIKCTYSEKTDPRHGVLLEGCLHWLYEN